VCRVGRNARSGGIAALGFLAAVTGATAQDTRTVVTPAESDRVLSQEAKLRLVESDLSYLISDAQAAQRRGECERFAAVLQKMDPVRFKAAEERQWGTQGTIPPNTWDELLEPARRWYATLKDEGCPKKSAGTATSTGTAVEVNAGGTTLVMPRRLYLGYESAGVPTVGLVSPDKTMSGASVAGSAKVDVSNVIPPIRLGAFDALTPKSTYMKIGFSYAKGDADQQVGTVSPGAGNRTLIPGPGGGSTGFSLGGFPANIVQNARYMADLNAFAGRLDLGQMCDYGGGLKVGGYGSVGYRRTNFSESFSGSVPGFAADFRYGTDVNVDQVETRVGLNFDFDLAVKRWLVLQFVTSTIFSGFVELGPDLLRGRGTDSLSFTGFPDSSAGLSKSGAGFGLSAGMGLSTKLTSGFELGLDGRYDRRPGLPVVTRDGTNPSALELKSADVWTASVRASFKF